MRFPNRVGEGAIPHPDAGDRDHDRCGHDQKEDQPKSEQSQLAHGHLSAFGKALPSGGSIAAASVRCVSAVGPSTAEEEQRRSGSRPAF